MGRTPRPARRAGIGAVLAIVITGTTLTAVGASASAPAPASRRAGGSGGEITFALEAESDPTNGFCIPRAQLAAAGIQVVAAVYDTLVTLDSKGEYVPYLAESVTPNATYDEWTIQLRDGIEFHDGSPFDADAVKLNLDSLRGANPDVNSPLSSYTLQEIDSVTVTGPLTVVVRTAAPWVDFPAFLFGNGRYGMSAPAQLNDQSTCATNLIGTGPFKLVEWRPNERLVVERNPDYWRRGLPEVDRITFVPVLEASQRDAGLEAGDYDVIQTADSSSIDRLERKAEAGEIGFFATDHGSETQYILLNLSKPPFDDPIARRAVAFAFDPERINEIRNKGLNTLATGPFPPDNRAYLRKPAVRHDLDRARALAKRYEAKHGEPLAWEYLTRPDPDSVGVAELVKEQNAEAGIDVSIRTLDQAATINEAIGGAFDAIDFRNHPGGDPDTQYIWWHSGFPTNFGRIDDAEVDRLLEEGRREPDAAKRTRIYKDLNRHFQRRLYDLWGWYVLWASAYQDDIAGVKGPPLPDGGGRPFALFAGVIPVAGLRRT